MVSSSRRASVANSMFVLGSNSRVMRDRPISEVEVILVMPLTVAQASSSGAVTWVWTTSGGTPYQLLTMSTEGKLSFGASSIGVFRNE